MIKYEKLKDRLEKAAEYMKKVYEADTRENQIKALNGLIRLNRMCISNLSANEYDNVKLLLDRIDKMVQDN